jgi:type VI secretion system protein ImpJ
MTAGMIVWREGMFIAPQHLQHLDRELRASMASLGRLDLSGDDFGLSRIRINQDLLAIGKVVVSEAAGLFPDQTYFDLAGELFLDVPDGTVDQVLLLAVPLHNGGITIVGETRGLHRWVVRDALLDDITDADAPPVEAELAAPGACLKLASDDLSGYACIPFARILEKTAEGRIVLDDTYLAVCIAIGASQRLLARLQEILSLARARANNAAMRLRLAQGAQSSASLIGERLELELLNRAIIGLQAAEHHPWMSPRRLYGLLAELLAGLDAHAARTTKPDILWNPLDPTGAFEKIITQLRGHLTLEAHANVISLTWNGELFEKRRLLRLVVPQRLLDEGRRPILAISDPGQNHKLGELVPKACKLAGISAMPELVTLGLQGVRLTHLPVAPPELRDKPDTAFFAVDTSSLLWMRFIEKKEALGLHIDERIDAPSATLYLIG